MRVWSSFLKRNGIWIALFLGMMAMQTIFFYILDIPGNDVWYYFLITGILFLLIMMTDFVRYVGKIRRERELAEGVMTGKEAVLLSEDVLEQQYLDIVREIQFQKNRELDKLSLQQREMQEYYAMWVHQIKTPIAAMQLLLQVEKTDLPQIHRELFSIEEYVGMALQYQRLCADQNDFVLQKVSLDSAIRSTIRKYAKVMVQKKLAVSYPGCSLTVVSDRKWIEFVIGQILSNAVKYSKSGTISFAARKETDSILLSIQDQGIGIRKEDLPRVFENGYTGYNGHMDHYSTGIGLYLCKKMIDKLGHTIRIESEEGKGTTVEIAFRIE